MSEGRNNLVAYVEMLDSKNLLFLRIYTFRKQVVFLKKEI